MFASRSKRWSIAIGAGGGAAVAVMLSVAVAQADDNGTDQINGWTVTTSGSGSTATLSDPSDSLGLGKTPIEGSWTTSSPSYLSGIGSNDQFAAPASASLTSSDHLLINNAWGPGFELASVHAGDVSDLEKTTALLVPSHDGNKVIDLFQFSSHDAAPLFNPDATGPINIGGIELASPDDGALLNNVIDAIFKGDTADWAKAETLFDDWLGIDPAGATDAVEPGSLLPDLGF